MRAFFRSIRVRLTLWYVLSLALLLLVISAGVYFALRSALRENIDESVESRAEVLLRLIRVEDGRPSLPINAGPPLDNEDDEELGEWDDDAFFRLYDVSGQLILDTSDREDIGDIPRERIEGALQGNGQWLRVRGDEDAFRVRIDPVLDGASVVGALAVGESEEDIAETLGSLLNIFVVITPVALIAIGLVGVFLSSRALAPIDRITRTTREITAKDLSRRLALDLPDDELGRLARTLDEMLSRLEAAFLQQRQFTSDASHELRTPLSVLKGEIEVALSQERTQDEYRETLERVAEQSERLINLVTSLLTLSRADAGEIPIEPERVEVRTLVEMTTAQFSQLADERDISLSVGGPSVVIMADTTLMIQLLLNLLDNAIEHTPAGGEVRVTWDTTDTGIQLLVQDNGAGIAAEHLPRIFDRFYRADPARSRERGGAGIGLAISRWIVEAHGGTITAASTVGRGTTMTIFLPLHGAHRVSP